MPGRKKSIVTGGSGDEARSKTIQINKLKRIVAGLDAADWKPGGSKYVAVTGLMRKLTK